MTGGALVKLRRAESASAPVKSDEIGGAATPDDSGTWSGRKRAVTASFEDNENDDDDSQASPLVGA